ncbi:MAG: hypothetical protein MZV64_61770 [Ignavibacteriales bacterium]|nr:hypothetical protein [Ignavibacteriales bacterium]
MIKRWLILPALAVNPTFLSDNSYNLFFNIYRQQKSNRSAGTQKLDRLLLQVSESIILVYKTGIIETLPKDILRDSIAVRIGNIDVIEPIKKYYTIDKARNEVKNNLQDTEVILQR